MSERYAKVKQTVVCLQHHGKLYWSLFWGKGHALERWLLLDKQKKKKQTVNFSVFADAKADNDI